MTRHRSTAAIAALLCLASAGTAFAQNRPYAPRMSCASLNDLIARQGARVVSTSPTTYDRFVESGQFCAYNQNTEPAWVVSSDQDQCFIGYTCRERDRDRF